MHPFNTCKFSSVLAVNKYEATNYTVGVTCEQPPVEPAELGELGEIEINNPTPEELTTKKY